MTRQVLVLMASAFVLAGGSIGAGAQQSSNPPMMQLAQAQQDPADEEGGSHPGHGMMRFCMRHCMMGHGTMGPVAMRIIFALMDSDGDGTVSLQEFQTAHERIFKAMDTDKDGTLTLEEMQDFMRGGGKSAPKQ